MLDSVHPLIIRGKLLIDGTLCCAPNVIRLRPDDVPLIIHLAAIRASAGLRCMNQARVKPSFLKALPQ